MKKLVFKNLKGLMGLIIFFILLFTQAISAQTNILIQGYINSSETGTGIENIRIEALLQSDTTIRQNTTSDATGFYLLNNFPVDINIPLSENSENISLQYQNNQMVFTIHTKYPLQHASLYNISGQKLAQLNLTRTGINEYTGSCNIKLKTPQIILFNDGFHSVKIPVLDYHESFINHKELHNGEISKSKSKALANTTNFIFRLRDAADNYQPVIDAVYSIDTATINYLDFELTPWPEFAADLSVFVNNYNNQAMQGVALQLENTETQQSYNISTDTDGNAIISDIEISALAQNRLLPDTVDFKLNINLENYREIIDTLELTDGSIDTSYILIPSQWTANVNVHVSNALDATNEAEVLAELWKLENAVDTLRAYTDANGDTLFENIFIPDYNTITPDTIKYILQLTKDGFDRIKDTLDLTEGEFIQNYQFLPSEEDIKLIIHSTTDGSTDLESTIWTLLDANDTTKVLGSGNTGANALDTLDMVTRLPSLDVILKSELADHDNYRSEFTLNANSVVNKTTVNTPQTPEEAVAYLWRKTEFEINTGADANIIVENSDFEYSDTIKNIAGWWKDTVPVNPTGTTNYTLKIIPNNPEGQIPLHSLEKIFSLQPDQELIGKDTLQAMEQEQKLKGWVKRLDDKQLTTLMDIIVESYDGTFRDSIRSTDGYFETRKLPIGIEGEGFEGWINVKPLGADSTDHLGLYKIPITTKEMSFDDIAALESEGDVKYLGRPVILPEKLTDFTDSIQQVNFMLTPKELTDAYTGAKLNTNPMHIFYMEGEPINSELSRYDTVNVWIHPDMNMTDYENFLTHIRTLFGKPFNENRVSEKFLFNDLEPYSLQNDNNKDKLGWNIRPGANGTTARPPPTVEGLILNIGGDMNLSLSNITGAMREYIIRTLEINVFPSSIRESLASTSIPHDFPDTANIEDRCYMPLFMDHRVEQVKGLLIERTHNNLGYLRDVKDFYNGKTLEEMYGN